MRPKGIHMILFNSDYALLPADHFDYTTANTSFLRLHAVLKKMGVKNNKFFLILLDKDLIGIDPHNLKGNESSIELKLRIVRECKRNPWYFFRSVLRIPETGSEGTPFQLSRANLSMIWLFFNHIDLLLIMPRQLGKSIGSISITSAIIYVLGLNVTFAMLTKDATLRKENVERLKNIRDALPEWFIHKQRIDVDNMESVSYEALNNKYISFVGQKSIAGAERLGRGMTVPSQHWDEPAFMPNIETTYPIAISTTNAAVESAKKNNQPYGNILTTTAGVLNTPEGVFTHKLMSNSLVFTEKLYDLKNSEELREIVKMNSEQRMVYCEYSYSQLGKTEEWFIEKSSRTQGGEDVIARDYLNRWTYGTGKSSPLDKKILDTLYEFKEEPQYIQYIDEFIIRWYIPESTVKLANEFKKIPIVIGMDASENVGRDFTSLVFTDARDLSVVGTCICNTVNIIKVAIFICRWLILENIVFIGERNSVGVAIIDYCLLQLEKLGINPFFKIFNTVIQELGENNISRAELNRPGFYNDFRREFGFRTSASTRPFLYKTVFGKVMQSACSTVKDTMLINQIAGLTTKNGRIDHGNGGNDDSVIAFILTGYLLFHGNNLEMYDFCKGNGDLLLKDLVVANHDGKPRNTIDLMNVEKLKEEVTFLENRSKHETNPTLKIEVLQKLQQLKARLPLEEDLIISDVQSVTQLKAKSPSFVFTGDNGINNSRQIFNYLSAL